MEVRANASGGLDPVQPSVEETRRSQRHANVYDAVAGRITFESRLDAATRGERPPNANPRPPKLSRYPVNASALAPEEVLFRRKAAPERFAEFDVYMAHERNLLDSPRVSLPDSDLLKAVHFYASHFYSALGGPKRNPSYQVCSRNIDEGSMDESALLAFGILLEEAGKEVLGSKGDMVFTEGLEIPAKAHSNSLSRTAANSPSTPLTDYSSRHPPSVSFVDLGSWKRASKRRKLTDFEDA
ncbi:membrane protein [Colletotrichum sublineola]|uniref:Putative membrane protein n=1 Tax=Colletotrichum sublineola TaxID=1173701 RepID=A0A066XBY5_COLSU|nr:membrane protein [Colletotrichum sublineola]KDN66467.1 putative membrane protein [Colletotrichum sublineola]